MMRDKDDKTRLSYWFPLIEAAGLPVPATRIIALSQDESTALAMHLFGECPADELRRLHAKIAGAADEVGGVPFFLRTDFTSAKHDWRETCCVKNADLVPHHIHAIWEYSECADMMGLPCDVWVVREMLKTVPLFHAFADMPITREFRFFVRDGKIEHIRSYWPEHSIIGPSCADWREKLAAASVLTADERQELERLTLRANAAVPGYWSVDWLQMADGTWKLTDMAEGGCSFRWDDPAFEKTVDNQQQSVSVGAAERMRSAYRDEWDGDAPDGFLHLADAPEANSTVSGRGNDARKGIFGIDAGGGETA